MNEKPQAELIAEEHFAIIAPIITLPDYEHARKAQVRREQAEKHNISVKTIKRYEENYARNGFRGLMPKPRPGRIVKGRPANWDRILEEAARLKREVPERSSKDIIKILESEQWVEAGVLTRQTLDRYFKKNHLTKRELLKDEKVEPDMSTRFCKPHRMMLVEGDLKDGPKLPIGKNGSLVKTYMSALIDDHSRVPIASGFYAMANGVIVEDTLRKALLTYGKMTELLFDNGGQYVSQNLKSAASKLGIRARYCKAYHPYTKGCIESFNRCVSAFMNEFELEQEQTLENMNEKWQLFVRTHYLWEPHEGIREYYLQRGYDVKPKPGISPMEEWNKDSRPLEYLDPENVKAAFIVSRKRKVTQGQISYGARKYFVSKGEGWEGQNIEILLDIDLTKEVKQSILCRNANGDTIDAKLVVIDGDIDYVEYAKAEKQAREAKEKRAAERKTSPEGSRLFRALERMEEEKKAADKDDPSIPHREAAMREVAPTEEQPGEQLEARPKEQLEEPPKEQKGRVSGHARVSFSSYVPDED